MSKYMNKNLSYSETSNLANLNISKHVKGTHTEPRKYFFGQNQNNGVLLD